MEQPFQTNVPMGQHRPSNDHDIILKNRNHLTISGVKQVDSFDNEQFLLETVMGFLSIRGQGLQMKSLDVNEGRVTIKGNIFDLIYVDEGPGEKTSLFGKLFK